MWTVRTTDLIQDICSAEVLQRFCSVCCFCFAGVVIICSGISIIVWCNISLSGKTSFLQNKWQGLPDTFLCDHMKVTQANLFITPQPSKKQTWSP